MLRKRHNSFMSFDSTVRFYQSQTSSGCENVCGSNKRKSRGYDCGGCGSCGDMKENVSIHQSLVQRTNALVVADGEVEKKKEESKMILPFVLVSSPQKLTESALEQKIFEYRNEADLTVIVQQRARFDKKSQVYAVDTLQESIWARIRQTNTRYTTSFTQSQEAVFEEAKLFMARC